MVDVKWCNQGHDNSYVYELLIEHKKYMFASLGIIGVMRKKMKDSLIISL